MFLFLLFDAKRRKWLLKPEPYFALLLGIFIFSPTLLWNLEHAFVSFKFQGSRGLVSLPIRLLLGGDAAALTFQPGRMVGFLAAQIGYYNPAVLVILVLGTLAFLRNRLALDKAVGKFLLFLGLPLVLRRGDRNVFIAIGIAAVVVAVFMLVVMASHYLGSISSLSPAFAAWAPLMLFVPAAVAMSEWIRQ